MNKFHFFALFCSLLIWDVHAAMDHSRHRGAGARGADKGSAQCVRPTLSKMQPAHLATVAPGSAFSFVLSNADDPEQVFVQVKREPVEIAMEFKDPFYIVSGKIPATLKNTAARIDVKIDSKIPSCRAEEGWLVKISE
ncbi:MAG: hypothetical protein FJ190_05890 [Gammaproteobacteria bacterium]|nr:hypothetical protein [Gammaproteobacteria bacterium]